MKSRRSAAEQDRLVRFAREYEQSQHPDLLAIERAVCGCAYGGTSWTTRAEAERVAELLELRAGAALLELGAGAGWPGLYFAQSTGCEVVLADVPLTGLRIAAQRAAADQLACRVVAADAGALPVKDAAFDAISHSDLLCCLVAKAQVLRECRRAVRSGGSMAFSVISIAPGLSPGDYRQAIAAGPPFKESELPYRELLGRSRWRITATEDLTAAYELAIRRMLSEEEARAGALGRILGESELAERLARRRRTLQAVEAGLLRRELFAARPA